MRKINYIIKLLVTIVSAILMIAMFVSMFILFVQDTPEQMNLWYSYVLKFGLIGAISAIIGLCIQE